ncbi:MAG TPA: hypothetical protein VGI10_02145 [Polyangiaceae bacterium]|jgi:hypothetical protein
MHQVNIEDGYLHPRELAKFTPDTSGVERYAARVDAAIRMLGKRDDHRSAWARPLLEREREACAAMLAAMPLAALEAARASFLAAIDRCVCAERAIEAATDAQTLVLARAENELAGRALAKEREAFVAAARAARPRTRGLELQAGLSGHDRDPETPHLARLAPGLDGYSGPGYSCPAYERACRAGKTTEPSTIVWEVVAESDFIASPLAEKMFALRWEYFARAHGLPFEPVELAPRDETLAESGRRKLMARWDRERAEHEREQAARWPT